MSHCKLKCFDSFSWLLRGNVAINQDMIISGIGKHGTPIQC